MRRLLLIAVAALAVGAPPAAGAADFGHLDPGFGAAGTFTSPTPIVATAPQDAALDAQGRVIVAVTKKVDANNVTVVVERLTADGRLDPSFDAAGPTPGSKQLDFSSVFPAATRSLPGGLAVLPDGTILVATAQIVPGVAQERIGVARLTPGGAYDPTFGGGTGRVAVAPPVPFRPFPRAIAVDGAGRMLLAGGTYTALWLSPMLVRLTADGQPDATFGSAGYVDLGASSDVGQFDDLVLSGNRVVVAGKLGLGAIVARFDAAGHLDPAFGSGGLTRLDLGRNPATEVAELFGLASDPDGRLIAAGAIGDGVSPLRGALARLSPQGALDAAWAPAAPFKDAHDVLVRGDRLVLAATTPAGAAALARTTAVDGAADPSFGDGGTAAAPVGDASAGLAVLPDAPRSRLLLVGTRTTAADGDRLIVQAFSDGVPGPPADPSPPAPMPPAAQPAPVAPPAPSAAPRPVTVTAATAIRWPSTRRCASRRRFTVHLRVPAGSDVTEAIIKVNGRRVTARKGSRLRAAVDLRGLPKGKITVTIQLKRASGATLTAKRVYRTCAAKATKKRR
jgi:uncharacterized delta-60 repeat protein